MPDLLKRTPEQAPRAPEQRPETGPQLERTRETSATPAGDREAPVPSLVVAVTPATPAAADPLLKKIEAILEDDLGEVYFKMTPAQQAVFKKKGEETSTKIRALLDQTKSTAKEILRLIVEWLKLIPGVNTFFLEQEAKIKTDRLIAWKQKQQKR